ncbi:hypothetical protein QWJ07_07885 [Frankia sp. RB7]|nr:hypothetical protein [Frankia sp. RB7]
MTRTDNRAIAKAHRQQDNRKLGETIDTHRVKADLVELDRLRSYLVKNKTAGYTRWLLDSIDDYVEQITGDRMTLQRKSSKVE